MQQHDTKHFGIAIVGVLIMLAAIGFCAWQTAQFVWVLFPDSSMTYRVLGVVCIDGVCLVSALGEVWYKFKDGRSKSLVFFTWWATFLLSVGATVIYMVLYASHSLENIDPLWVNAGYAIVIIATAYDVIVAQVVLRNELGAGHRVGVSTPRVAIAPAANVSLHDTSDAVIPGPTQSQSMKALPPLQARRTYTRKNVPPPVNAITASGDGEN